MLACTAYVTVGQAAAESPPCFTLHSIQLMDPMGQPTSSRWQAYVDDLSINLPACFSGNDINDLQQSLTARLLADGWVTTRIGIPVQDITTGKLQLTLFVGRLAQVMETTDLPSSAWRPALAVSEGEPLNLRDIEQTVEQLERLPSQKVQFEIIPGQDIGTSDLSLSVDQQSKPLRLDITWDDQGPKDINSNQWTTNIAMDGLFRLPDTLDVSSVNAVGQGGFSHNTTATWSLGWGYNNAAIESGQTRVQRVVPGTFQTFVSATKGQTDKFSYSRRLYRNNDTKVDFHYVQGRNQNQSFVDGTEIRVQRSNRYWQQAGMGFEWVDTANWLVTLKAEKGSPWLGGDDDPADRQPHEGTQRYLLRLLDVSRSQTWNLASGNQLVWDSVLHAQDTPDVLLANQYLTLGSRSSVRGFGTSLRADKGWYWRNQLALNIPQRKSKLTAALDMGEVSGPATSELPGTQLVGLHLGAEKGIGKYTINMEIGIPVYAPDELQSGRNSTWFMSLKGSF